MKATKKQFKLNSMLIGIVFHVLGATATSAQSMHEEHVAHGFTVFGKALKCVIPALIIVFF